MLSHSVPDGDLAAVLHEAVRCALTAHGKRRGRVEPAHEVKRKPAGARSDAERAPGARSTSAPGFAVRSGSETVGRCAWTSADGRRCTSTWKLELDHIHPVALGGRSTVANLRLACRVHNVLHAEAIFGAEYMAQFTRGETPTGENDIAGES